MAYFGVVLGGGDQFRYVGAVVDGVVTRLLDVVKYRCGNEVLLVYGFQDRYLLGEGE